MDDEALAVYVHGDWWLQAATPARICFSWEGTHQAAIALMRKADAKRWQPGQEP